MTNPLFLREKITFYNGKEVTVMAYIFRNQFIPVENKIKAFAILGACNDLIDKYRNEKDIASIMATSIVVEQKANEAAKLLGFRNFKDFNEYVNAGGEL